jgi:fructan beta-fructosidase
MTLAVKDHISFYSSINLKNWIKESEFGKNAGAHGGVWECPDLFSLDYNGKPAWVLIVNLNLGGTNKDSGTQYFLGDFDGKKFLPYSTDTKRLDYGPDEYAGITWSNTGKRKIFLGWMTNWMYANVVPTETWRNAMTIPRELRIVKTGKEILIASGPVSELTTIKSKPVIVNNISLSRQFEVSENTGSIKFPCLLNLSLEELNDFSVLLSNSLGEELLIGYDKIKNQYFIDRSKSDKTDFKEGFAAKHTAPRFAGGSKMNLSLLLDVSSVELFADDGLTVMTEIFFPNSLYNKISIQSNANATIKSLEYRKLKVESGSK